MMIKIVTVMMVVLMAASVMAEGISGSVTLDAASAYVFRGSTFNDGAVLQPGAEAAAGDLAVGVWANFDIDDYDGALDDNEFSEVDLYGSYSLPVETADISVGYTVYTYPLDSTDADHEVSLSIGLDMILAPTLGIYYGLDGGIEESVYLELGVAHGIELSDDLGLELGAALAYLEPDAGESGFSHADISASLSYKSVSASVTYVAQIDDDVLMDVADGGSYDAEVFAVVGTGVEF